MDWLIGEEWKCPQKGLLKKVLNLHFEKVQKPTECSNCKVKISNIENVGARPSSYLVQDKEFLLEMGTAKTPIDCYIEILVQNMLLGETSLCQIQTKSGQPISFKITLSSISSNKYLFELTLVEMFDLAQKYRSNGVEMFKLYPKFAHEYFCRAAKFLMSFKPFDVLTKTSNGIEGSEVEALFQTLQTNIAACLLQEQRYEDVLYQTEFVDELPQDGIEKVEKAVYRRALAFYNVKAYEKALATLKKISGMHDKTEFLSLYNRTKQAWKREEDQYKTIVQRMFN